MGGPQIEPLSEQPEPPAVLSVSATSPRFTSKIDRRSQYGYLKPRSLLTLGWPTLPAEPRLVALCSASDRLPRLGMRRSRPPTHEEQLTMRRRSPFLIVGWR